MIELYRNSPRVCILASCTKTIWYSFSNLQWIYLGSLLFSLKSTPKFSRRNLSSLTLAAYWLGVQYGRNSELSATNQRALFCAQIWRSWLCCFFLEHDMTPEKKQQRQAKYREELQAQIKEREMMKKRYVLRWNINHSGLKNKIGRFRPCLHG